jgi:hypothetical protein
MPDPPDYRAPVSVLIAHPRPPGVRSLDEVERGWIGARRERHDSGRCNGQDCPICEFGKSLAIGGPRR